LKHNIPSGNIHHKLKTRARGKGRSSTFPLQRLDDAKITGQTRNVLIVGYGAPGITEEQLNEGVETTISYIELVSHGETETMTVFNAQ
jgi:DNA/RNA-binding domain of Phe-tRNA-synthetase-like protein